MDGDQRQFPIQGKGALQGANRGFGHGAPLLMRGIGAGRLAKIFHVLAHQAHLIDAAAVAHGNVHANIAQPRFLPHPPVVHAAIGGRVDLGDTDGAVIHLSMESRGDGRLYIPADLLGVAPGGGQYMDLGDVSQLIFADVGGEHAGDL